MGTAPTALVTLGRLPKALDIARALHGAGWRVLVAEPFVRHLTGASNAVSRSIQVTAPTLDGQAYLQELRQIIAAESVDLVVPVSEETMHVAALHDCGVRVFTMPPDIVRYLYDKLGFIQFSQSLGLTVPRTTVMSDPVTAATFRSAAVTASPRRATGSGGRSKRQPATRNHRERKHDPRSGTPDSARSGWVPFFGQDRRPDMF